VSLCFFDADSCAGRHWINSRAASYASRRDFFPVNGVAHC
jgi:hypothetical protein